MTGGAGKACMLTPVILAGGQGTRLWPVSRPEHPKPLIRLTGGLSLLQETVRRAAAVPGADRPIIVCSQAHHQLIVRQLEEIDALDCTALLEPFGRSTAPAAAAAALSLDEDRLMLVLPADHLVDEAAAFAAAVQAAAPAAASGWLTAFGAAPDRPETGYGYIEAGGPLPGLADGVRRIASFREKPDLPTARRWLEAGRHLWNSGMFLFQAGAYLEELRLLHPEIATRTEAALAASPRPPGPPADRGALLDPIAFGGCPSESIDRAVMERTRRGAVVPLAAGWKDVGSWRALWELGPRDEAGNAASGPVHLQDASSSLVRAEGGRLVSVVGLEGVIVVDSGGAVLVAGMDRAQDVAPPPPADRPEA